MPMQNAPGGAHAGRAAGNDGLNHHAYLYDDERDYLSCLSEFVQAGLRNAEPVFVAVPGRHAAVLRELLGAESPLLRYGAMTETGRNPARLIPELYAFVAEHPGQRVRYIGESAWPGRTDAELCEAARHEALLNLAFATTSVSIMCPYDIRAETLGYETSLRQARDLVASHGAALGMAAERITNLVIAAGEITANTLRHTSAGGRLWVWHTGEEIICQVQDQGWITDPLAGRQRHSPEDSGHGLWVVNQMCDLVEIRTSQAAGTIIRLHMRREDG